MLPSAMLPRLAASLWRSRTTGAVWCLTALGAAPEAELRSWIANLCHHACSISV